MKTVITIISALILFSSCSKQTVRSEFDFANKLAQRGLWKEANYRWEKSLSKGNDSASIHNNIAISMEQRGDLKGALKEYKKALKIAPGNRYIKENLKRLEIRIKPPEDKKPRKEKKK
ncbi:MAG: tetratricopeptide repeat protein [Acidobacteriota bacterium]